MTFTDITQRVAMVLLAVGLLAGVAEAQPEKVRPVKPAAAKPAAKGKAGRGFVLDEAVRAKAMADPDAAGLLAMRTELDKLVVEYRSLALTKGVKAHPKATRKLPTLARQIEKIKTKLEALTDRNLVPREKQLAKDKQREGKLLGKLEKLQEAGRDKDVRKLEKDIDTLRNAIEAGTLATDILLEVGKPEVHTAPPQTMLLEELIKPNEQEEKTLRTLAQKQPELVGGRLLIVHLKADLAKAKGETEGHAANPEQAASIERQLGQVEKKFAKYFLDIWEPIAEQEDMLVAQKEKTEEKVAKLSGKGAADKYQRQLATIERKLEGERRTSGLYKKIARGTPAAEALAKLAAEKKAKKKGDK